MNTKDMSTIINLFLWTVLVMSVDASMTFLPRRYTRIHLPFRPIETDINLHHNTYITILRGGHNGEDTNEAVEKDTSEDNDNKDEDDAWSEEIRRTREFYNTPRFSQSKDILIAGSSVTTTPSEEENVVMENERVFGNASTRQLEDVDNDAKRTPDSEKIKESEESSEVILEEGGDVESDEEAEGVISIQDESESTSEIISRDDDVNHEEEERVVELEDMTPAINEEAAQLAEKEYDLASDTVDVEEDTTSDIVDKENDVHLTSEETGIIDKEDGVDILSELYTVEIGEQVLETEIREEVDVAQEEKNADNSQIIDELDKGNSQLANHSGGNKSLKEGIVNLCQRLRQKVSTPLYVAPAVAVSLGVMLTFIFSPSSLCQKLSLISKRDVAPGIEEMQAIDLSDDADDEDIDEFSE